MPSTRKYRKGARMTNQARAAEEQTQREAAFVDPMIDDPLPPETGTFSRIVEAVPLGHVRLEDLSPKDRRRIDRILRRDRQDR